jgi:hypothetical protein
MKFSKVYLTMAIMFLSFILVSHSSRTRISQLGFIPAKNIKPIGDYKLQSPIWQEKIKQLLREDENFKNHFKNIK